MVLQTAKHYGHGLINNKAPWTLFDQQTQHYREDLIKTKRHGHAHIFKQKQHGHALPNKLIIMSVRC